ncbi:OmpA family protein [Herbaspirillum seropedicae]|uniref:OmpA/MotB family protein n=1 Tax=Herbaspirillum seropedicae TaxID=964 RepID=UPI00111F9D53|nr:OmpA family protein [Herbaspirillum seropedicae]QDD66458.1 OmpA family protein [Herbaspirillum seropedicae]
MKDAQGEWVVVANLMAAVAAVLTVLLVVARAGGPAAAQADAVQARPQAAAAAPVPSQPLAPAAVAPAAARAPAPAASAPQESTQGPGLTVVLRQVQTVFAQQGAASLVAVDTEAGKITLKEGAFRRGSACVESEAKAAFAQVEERIAEYLQQNPAGRIYVEGHTDDKPVKAPVTDVRAFCTVYDDNITLSAARARQARLLLVGRSSPEAARRVIVAGYGDSQPLPGLAASDERNRRVEVRFVSGAQKP